MGSVRVLTRRHFKLLYPLAFNIEILSNFFKFQLANSAMSIEIFFSLTKFQHKPAYLRVYGLALDVEGGEDAWSWSGDGAGNFRCWGILLIWIIWIIVEQGPT